MDFIAIKMDTWARKQHYRHYLDKVRCTYSVTVHIDISNLLDLLKRQGLKAYPAQVYMLATAVNRFAEFRMSTDEAGNVGYWKQADPIYTVLNKDTETFSAVWTPYHHDFPGFYQACLSDMEQYATGALFPQQDIPPNTVNISSVPWLDFSAFNINVFSQGDYLMPLFTIGKYTVEDGSTLLPVAIQCHHAVCDGLHVGRFVEALRQMAEQPENWLGDW